MSRTLLLSLIVFGPMLLEARRSRRNDRWLRSEGAVEPGGDVYRLMQVAYPGSFLVMILEGWVRSSPGPWTLAGATIFAAGKVLKYWAIATLGPRWTFRVLVPPGAPRVAHGPYRWLRHPNYAGVACELAGIALVAPAPATGVLSIAIFGSLMLARIRVEERALDVCGR